MKKEDLELLKKKISTLSDKQKIIRSKYLAQLARGDLQGPPVGYPSIDKPWLQYYPDMLFSEKKQYNKILDRLKDVWHNEEYMIDYYGTQITAEKVFTRAQEIANALKASGIKEKDSIVVSLDSTPEFIELLLASEIIGCSIKNYQGKIEDVIDLINDKDKIYITHDYITKKDSNKIYEKTNVEHIITIDPLFSNEDKNKIRANILEGLHAKYKDEISDDSRNISFASFLEKGKQKSAIPVKNSNQLFSAFTSGTTGKPKEVRHSSQSILGIVNQMSLFPSHEKQKDTWLLTILPPTLVAVVVAMICYPLADGKKVILDPYCKIEDIDLEIMHYEPNCWPAIPIFFSTLLESKRIPEDYDMSYFKLFGFGAEPLHTKFLNKVQTFLNKHNCKAPLSAGYGQSEGGSDFTVAMGIEMLSSGSSGIPLIDTNIAIYNPKTSEELGYNQIGEIGKSGPGLMLGYSDEELTKQVMKEQPDGNVWLYTQDYGFMTEQGFLFVLGRKGIQVFPDKQIFPLGIENKVLSVEEVKEAIIVSGKDKEHQGYEVPYLFIVPEEDADKKIMLEKINNVIENNLLNEESPRDIFLIEKKPISKFKTDRKLLQKQYKL